MKRDENWERELLPPKFVRWNTVYQRPPPHLPVSGAGFYQDHQLPGTTYRDSDGKKKASRKRSTLKAIEWWVMLLNSVNVCHKNQSNAFLWSYWQWKWNLFVTKQYLFCLEGGSFVLNSLKNWQKNKALFILRNNFHHQFHLTSKQYIPTNLFIAGIKYFF